METVATVPDLPEVAARLGIALPGDDVEPLRTALAQLALRVRPLLEFAASLPPGDNLPPDDNTFDPRW